ncbi:MAG: hypothetical protein P8Z37_09745 [Acidobacteriota bacterium]
MAEEKQPQEYEAGSEKKAKKKQSQLSSLILAGVFLLGIFLPARYKAFAPLLFLVVPVIKVLNKWKNDPTEQTGMPSAEQPAASFSPYKNDSTDPYSYQPKDPKDPRKYKPIG